MEPFQRIESRDIPAVYLLTDWMRKFPYLEAGISTRLGGVSGEGFRSLNCGLHVNDVAEHVVSNRRRLAAATRLPFEVWTYAEQVHDCHVAVVTEGECGAGRETMADALQATDALITDKVNISLSMQFADCVPLFFIDPVHRAVGIAHAGWKGTVLKVAMATIDKMKHTFGSQPQNMFAAIGPSIGVCCYEVDGNVIARVDEVLRELQIDPPSAQTEEKLVYFPYHQGKYKLDLQQLNRQIMIKAGILLSNIEVTKLCTSCRTDLFFSHRKEAGSTGRMSAWIGMV